MLWNSSITADGKRQSLTNWSPPPRDRRSRCLGPSSGRPNLEEETQTLRDIRLSTESSPSTASKSPKENCTYVPVRPRTRRRLM
ncbi:hypothetical protein CGRA01v4_14744 [Colletotrichum graminicola]|nr:hypothetical protein CGRA01v4_14744 [Colletotrichum graminicola]